MTSHPLIDAFKNSDALGMAIFIALFFMLIITCAIVIYKVWLARIVYALSDTIEDIFHQKKKTPLNIDLNSLAKHTNAPNPFFEIYQALKKSTLDILKKNKAYLSSKEGKTPPVCLSPTDIEQLGVHASGVMDIERKELERYHFIFSTIVTLGPLLGLLGTVWGISSTLAELPKQANVLSNDAVLSSLAMALGTTVLGIIVAIPALIANNYFKYALDEYALRMDEFSSKILSNIEMLYRAVDVKA